MKTPSTLEEYQARYERNHRVHSGGTQDLPCPFCAAPGWIENAVTGESSTPARCLECGRTAQIIRTEQGRSQVPETELVQVAGPDAPAYLDPAPRRVEPVRDAIDPLAHSGRETGRYRLTAPPVAVRRLRRPRRMRGPG